MLETEQNGAVTPTDADLRNYLVCCAAGFLPTCPAGATAAIFASSYTVNDVSTVPGRQIAGLAQGGVNILQ